MLKGTTGTSLGAIEKAPWREKRDKKRAERAKNQQSITKEEYYKLQAKQENKKVATCYKCIHRDGYKCRLTQKSTRSNKGCSRYTRF